MKCTFSTAESRCNMCLRKNLECGVKTRRGGAQGTVRISVLEQLLKDYPTLSLKSAIDHLKGKVSAIVQCKEEENMDASVSMRSFDTRTTISNASDATIRHPTASQPMVLTEPSGHSEPLSMELTPPGISPQGSPLIGTDQLGISMVDSSSSSRPSPAPFFFYEQGDLQNLGDPTTPQFPSLLQFAEPEPHFAAETGIA